MTEVDEPAQCVTIARRRDVRKRECGAARRSGARSAMEQGSSAPATKRRASRPARSHAARDHGLRTTSAFDACARASLGISDLPRARNGGERAAIARDERGKPRRERRRVRRLVRNCAQPRHRRADTRKRRIVDLAIAAQPARDPHRRTAAPRATPPRTSPRNRSAARPATARACRPNTSCIHRPRRRGAARRAADTACRRVRAPIRASARTSAGA